LRFSWPAALLCAGLGVIASVVGGAWPAARAARLAPAQALKGLGGKDGQAPPVWPGLALLVLGAGLALVPPLGGLPLAAYACVAAWLVGGISLLPAAVRLLLGQRGTQMARHPLWLLALQRARFFRGTATAAVAGVVASLALCVALTVMVASFRDAVSDWLDTVLPADLYVRAGAAAQVVFPAGLAQRAAGLPGVQRVSGGRSLPLSLDADQPDVWLQARALGQKPEQALPLVAPPLALPPGELGVFVSEAVVALHAVQPGQALQLPVISAAGKPLRVWVRGVWRDYARQFGAIAIDLADYQRATGDTRLNDLALWLAPGASLAQVEDGVRQAVADAGGEPQALSLSSTAQLKALSLRIFDRSFAVTRYLQAVAIAIGLAGVAASLSAQVLARQREFGLLAHLGLTRAQVMRLVMLETAGWLSAGLVVGLALGLAISAVLVWVVNPQSFHWSMALRVPVGAVSALLVAVLLAGLGTSALTARRALSASAVRAVKEDW
jgi:putative ABC transport system permease protein